MVTFTYRTQPDSPPDVQTIQKQMAIVAWQPGPNKVVQVPSEVRSSVVFHVSLFLYTSYTACSHAALSCIRPTGLGTHENLGL